MPESKKKSDKKANRRGAARLAAVQALYQMDIAGAGIDDVFAEFESHWIGGEVEGEKYLPAEAAFFRDVVAGVVRDQAKLDPLIDDALSKGWPLKRIDAILRAVLRAGSYELEHRKDVPGRVVVSEYVDVAHAFVEKDETGMVNAVLDQIARQFRADEFARGQRVARVRRGLADRALFQADRDRSGRLRSRRRRRGLEGGWLRDRGDDGRHRRGRAFSWQ